MRFSVEFESLEIIIKADPDGQFVSFQRLKEHIEHLINMYKVRAIKVNNTEGAEISFESLSDDEVLELIDFSEPRKCPECRAVMEDGTCYTQSTLTGFLAFGWSYKSLFFRLRYNAP